MKPYFQGKLDVFCPIYAVLNALQLTHRLRMSTARDILHESLMAMSENRSLFRAQLNQDVEYHDLVDEILVREAARLLLHVHRPFTALPDTRQEAVWQLVENWLEKPQRAVIVRFVRPLPLPGEPHIRHWTTVQAVEDGSLTLFDCSLDENAIFAISRNQLAEYTALQPGLVHLDPSSVRCLAPLP